MSLSVLLQHNPKSRTQDSAAFYGCLRVTHHPGLRRGERVLQLIHREVGITHTLDSGRSNEAERKEEMTVNQES